MRCAAGVNARSPSRTAVGRDAERARERSGRQRVGHVVRRARAYVVDGAELLRRLVPVRDEGPVDEEVVDHAQHRQRRRTEREADRPAALDDVRLLDHPQRHRVLHVVDDGLLRPLVHPRLRRDVGLHGAEVVDVVVGDVEAHRGDRAHGVDERQLRRADLDGDHVELVMHHDVDERVPDVAGRHGAVARRTQHRLEHQRGRRLAVGARDAQPCGSRVGMAEAPRQLQLPPHRDPSIEGLDDDRGGRAQARRDHEQVRARRSGALVPEKDGHADDVEDLRPLALPLAVAGVDDRDPCTELREGVRAREPRDADPDHGHRPVGPLGEPVQVVGVLVDEDVRRHERTHSA